MAAVKDKDVAADQLAEFRGRIACLQERAQEMEAALVEPHPLRELRRVPATTRIEELVRSLDEDGAVIIERLVSKATADRVVAEMRPYIAATPSGEGFAGNTTKRSGAVAARSETSWQLLAHPVLKGVCEEVLAYQKLKGKTVRSAKSSNLPGTRKYPWIVSLTQIIDIGPGGEAQPIHTDEAWCLHDFAGELELEVSTIWALTDFTEENGATRVVPGSHRPGRGPRRGSFKLEESTHAAMPRGSVLVYLGSVYHGGGHNRSNERRIGLNVDYCVGFLRQEENQYLACPPQEARRLPRDVQDLLGYKLGGYALGYVADAWPPYAQLTPGVDVMVPGSGNAHTGLTPKGTRAPRTFSYKAKL